MVRLPGLHDRPEVAQNDAQAKAMLAKGARLQGIPGMQEPIKLWRMDGMVTEVDGATDLPDQRFGRQSPRSRRPTAARSSSCRWRSRRRARPRRRAAKPGDQLITVWSQQTAIKATVIR